MNTFDVRTPFGKAVIIVIAIITASLLYESSFQPDSEEQFKPKENQACEGEPIRVDYAYNGGMNSPHGCAPQCEDGKQRYLLYTNGKATQCQTVPGCLDWGEDQGVTCIPTE